MSTTRRWISFLMVFLVGLAGFINMFKCAPLMPALLGSDLGFTPDTIGWMMSMFGIIGAILAFPAGLFINKFGLKVTLITSIACSAAGSILGAMSPSAVMLLATRVLEGAGVGFAGVAGSVAVTRLLPAKRQGFGQALNIDTFPLGTLLAMNVAPMLLAAGGGSWRTPWWTFGIFSAVCLVLVVLFFKLPEDEPDAEEAKQAHGGAAAAPMGKPKWVPIVLLAVAFALYATVQGGAVSTFYPTYLQQVMGLDVQASGSITSISSLIVLFVSPFAGAFADKVGHRKLFVGIGCLVMAIGMPVAFAGNMVLVWVFSVALGLVMCVVPPNVYAMVPPLAGNPKSIVFAMALLGVAQNLGTAMGSALMGPLSASSWSLAATVLAVLAAVAAVASLLARAK